MPSIRTRKKLTEYALRALGHPVIEVNVDDDQVEDRVDDAIRFFSEYHFDGVERVYLKYQIQEQDIQNKYISIKADNPGFVDLNEKQMAIQEEGVTAADILLEDLVTSVTRIFHVTGQSVGMFDVRYQYALNDLYTFGTIDLVQYDLTQQYLSLLRQFLSPEKMVNFSRVKNQLRVDMDWKFVQPGQYFVIEAYRILDPRVYTEVYEDRMLKRYVTALIKKQWGVNLSKYNGIKLPGDITFNGDKIMTEATAEIDAIEKDIIAKYELPTDFMVG
jgi:hypothetical protein